jgi:hypothetical protein
MWASKINLVSRCNQPCSVLFLAEARLCFTWSDVTDERVVAHSYCSLNFLGFPLVISTVPDKAANFASACLSFFSACNLLVDSWSGAAAIIHVPFLTISARGGWAVSGLAEARLCCTWSDVTDERVVAHSYCSLNSLGSPSLISTVPDNAIDWASALLSLVRAELLFVELLAGAVSGAVRTIPAGSNFSTGA